MKNPIWLTSTLVLLLLQGCSEGPVRKTYDSNETPTSPPNQVPSEALRQVQSLYQRGEFQKALNIIDITPEERLKSSDRAEFQNLKGLSLLATKKPIQAEAAFRKAIKENTHSEYKGYFEFNLATALYDSQKTDESMRVLEKIDSGLLDGTHQRKVLALKEKIASIQNGLNKPKASPPSVTEVIGSAASSPLGSTTAAQNVILPPPSEVYHGAVNPNKIGILLPLTGKYEAFGNRAKRTIEMAFQESELGKRYELVSADSGETTETRLAALKKLVEQDEVIAIMGPMLSKDLETFAQQAAFYQVPMVSLAQAQGPAASHLFSCSISNQDQVTQVLEYAMNVKGFKRFAVIAPKNKSCEELAKLFWDEVDARKGEIKAFEFYDPAATDFREPVDKSLGLYYQDARSAEIRELAKKREELKITKKTMKTAQYFNLPPVVDFDAVFIPDEARTAGQLIPTFAYRDADKITFMGISSWNSSQLVQRAQNSVEGAFFTVGYNSTNPSNITQKFMDQFKTFYNGSPGEIEAIAYDAAALVLKALSDKPSSREDFREKLEQPGTVEGGTGIVSMQNHRCSRKLALYQVEKGKFISVSSDSKD